MVKLVHINNVSLASVVTLNGKIIFGCLDTSCQIFMFPRHLLAILKHVTDRFLCFVFLAESLPIPLLALDRIVEMPRVCGLKVVTFVDL